MSPTPPSQGSSGVPSPEDNFRVVRKRNRVPLSCYPCRTRKLKCDRSHPCSNCVKREGGDTSGCSYASPAARKKNQSQGATGPDDMQNRINRLEGLVLSLMHGGANIDATSAAAAAVAAANSGSTPAGASNSGSSTRPERDDDGMRLDGDDAENDEESDVDDGLANSLGVLKVDADKGKSMYIGQEHWHTILADISEVKNFFSQHKKDLERSYEKVLSSKPVTARDLPTLLLGAPPATEIELRAELPPKSSVVTLIGRYFNSMDNAVNIIHAPTFHAMLRSHWQDPNKTPVMWIGLLYSILTLAMLSYHKVGDEPPEWKGRSLELASLYRMRTVQCLITADYTKPVEYTVETMVLYVFGEFSTRWDADMGLWLMAGMIVRIALRMGYHRDAKWFPNITPFQAEMRRRIWALVRMSDIVFAHQVSLPSMIQSHDCDTQLPHNIFDEEFGPNTKVLPPSRPDTEPTPISYMITKCKLCFELGTILQTNGKIGKPVPYDEILRLDARLKQVGKEIPPHLRVQPLEGSHDPLTLIVARFNIDILYNKISCLLHRNYISRARHNPRYDHSRRTAIESSLQTLGHLKIMRDESEDSGRLRSIKWYITSVATKDFLLPAMLIALELHWDNIPDRQGERHNSESMYFWTPEQRQEMISVLETTRDIWNMLKDGSVEAYKAYNVLRIVLEKIHNPPSPERSAQAKVSIPSMGTMPTNPQCTIGLDESENPSPHISSIPTTASANSWPDSSGRSSSATTSTTQPTEHHAAAQTLGMLSAGGHSGATPQPMTPNTAASLFGTVQSPGGTNYPALDPSLGPTSDAMPVSGATPSGYQADVMPGMDGMPMNFSADMFGPEAMDFTSNFDWDSFQQYAQTGNFGTDESFSFFQGNGQDPNLMDSNNFSWGSPRKS